MCHIPTWFLNFVDNTAWLEVIKAIAPIMTAVIAFMALQNWKRQDKAKKEIEFLDSLIESTHNYISQMAKPIGHFQVIKIGMESYIPSGVLADGEIRGAISFIQQNGEQQSKRLSDALEPARAAVTHLSTLAAKGQVFKFEGYARCQSAVDMLIWQFNRIEAFMAMIRSSTLNWNHPKVLKVLRENIKIDPEDIQKKMQESNVILLEFFRDSYDRIYK